jgi:hypothetical protein
MDASCHNHMELHGNTNKSCHVSFHSTNRNCPGIELAYTIGIFGNILSIATKDNE